jgi:hypothetical protein
MTFMNFATLQCLLQLLPLLIQTSLNKLYKYCSQSLSSKGESMVYVSKEVHRESLPLISCCVSLCVHVPDQVPEETDLRQGLSVGIDWSVFLE